MKGSTFEELCAALEILPPFTPLTDASRALYGRLFSQAPQAIMEYVPIAITMEFEKRPAPKQVVEMIQRLMQGDNAPSVLNALREVNALRKKFGTKPVQDGWYYPMTSQFVEVTGEDGEIVREYRQVQCGDRFPRMVEGMPAFSDPAIAPVIEALNGWTAFAEMAEANSQNFWQPSFERLYQAQTARQGNAVMRTLKLEFRERLAALPAPPPVPDAGQKRIAGLGSILDTASPGLGEALGRAKAMIGTKTPPGGSTVILEPKSTETEIIDL